MQYHLPGLLVRERTLAVPLDWSSQDGEQDRKSVV